MVTTKLFCMPIIPRDCDAKQLVGLLRKYRYEMAAILKEVSGTIGIEKARLVQQS